MADYRIVKVDDPQGGTHVVFLKKYQIHRGVRGYIWVIDLGYLLLAAHEQSWKSIFGRVVPFIQLEEELGTNYVKDVLGPKIGGETGKAVVAALLTALDELKVERTES